MSANKYAGLSALQENVVKTKEHVEAVRAVLDAQKANVFAYSSLPQNPIEGMIIMWVGADTASYKKGAWYQYVEVTPATEPKTYTWEEITASIEIDNALNLTSGNPVANSALTSVIQALQGGVLIIYGQESEMLQVIDYAGGQIVALGTICYCVAEQSWYKVTAINSSSLAVTWTAYDPHIASDDDVETRLEKVTALPTATADTVGKVLLLTANQTGYTRGGIYKSVSDGQDPPTYSWELISISPLTFDTDDFSVANDNVALNPKQRVFKGTQATWNTLSTADKAKYEIVILTDDTTAGTGDDRKQPKLLQTPIVIDGVTYTSVEDALQYMAYTINNLLIWNSGI